jgi:hypothetical protein
MSGPQAQSLVRFADDGAYIARDPTTGRYTLYTATGTALVSFDSSGNMTLLGKLSSYNGLATSGLGMVTIVSAPTILTDKTSAASNFINYTPPSTAGVYRIIAMVNVTAWTTPATFTVVVTYTDNKGNARTETLALVKGSSGAGVAAVTTVDRYYATPFVLAIDNSGTAITLSTTGTFTGSPVYQLAGLLERVI